MKDVLLRVREDIKSGFVFKVLYLLLAFLSFNSLFANRPILTYSSYLLTAVGLVYLLYRFFHFNQYRKTKGCIVLLFFVGSYIISSLLTIRYGILENVKGAIWMIFQFFLLYAYDYRVTKSTAKREFKIFSHIFVGYTFLMAVAGLILFFMNYHSYQIINGKRVIIGFLWKRLWGLYSDPNYGAVFGVITIILCLYYFITVKKVWLKVFYAVSIILQISYIAFSDSRTSLVAFMATGGIMAFLFSIRWKKLQKYKTAAKVTISLMLALVCCVLPYFVIHATVDAGNYALQWLYRDDSETLEGKPTLPPNEETDSSLNIGREDEDINNDISNRRFSIWKSALEISATKPVFGVSFRNIYPYAKENLPATYIVNNDFTAFSNLHNMFFDLLVSQGIVGVVLFVIFIVLIIKTVFTRLFKKEGEEYHYYALLLSSIIPIAISAFFYSEILYINTGGAVFFWCVLGYLILGLTKENTAKKEVGILTFHSARNFGACLQVFALQTKLEELNYSAEIVDYRPAFIEDDFGIIIKNHFRQAAKNPLKLAKFFINTLLHLPWRTLRENNFIKFYDKAYRLSEGVYHNAKQLKYAAEGKELFYSAYLFGSDQIWNPALTRGVDEIFYGGFVSESSVKASYAASMGSAVLTEDQLQQIKKGLQNLDYISVREPSAKQWLEKLTSKKINVNIDPTLLLTAEKWESYCMDVHMKQPYILVYVLEHNEELISMISALAKETGLPVVFFDLKNRYGCKAISKYASDPFAFISYIRQAEYVITNSFHGTVFSIIFKKQFICVPNRKNPLRVTNLLTELELQERLVYSRNDMIDIRQPVDFKGAHEKINELRAAALDYLTEVLSAKKDGRSLDEQKR